MKKLATLLLAAGMVVAASAPASAADVKLDGFYRYSFQTTSTGFEGENLQRNMQRMRLGLTITTSENLKGYTQFQLGTTDFGTSPKHGKTDVQSRQYYIDWTVPGAPVKVRMGRQALGLPADSFGGNNFLGAAWGPRDGIVVSAKATDWLSVSALWARAAENCKDTSNSNSNNTDVDTGDSLDVFGVAAKLKFDGFTIEPWAAYADMGEGLEGHNGYNNSDIAGAYDKYESDTYAFGATFTMTYFDPFKLVVSAAYASRDYKDTGIGDVEDRDGYSIDAKASYKLGFGTPFVAGWYTSGDDAEDQKNGNYRGGWMPGINSYSSPTATFFDASTSLDAGVDRYTTLGTWGAQLGIEGMSFLKDLTHTATVTWIQGTNNTNGADDSAAALNGGKGVKAYSYMTTADSVVELALTSDYNIYKNLVATLELAYLISDFDENVWHNADGSAKYDEDDWRVGLTFTYKF